MAHPGGAYAYDAENRLIRADIAGVGAAVYRYDAEGHRVKKTFQDRATYFIYDLSRNILEEYEGPNDDEDLALPTALPEGLLSFHHLDHLGSVRVVTDARGEELRRYDYYPFGGERDRAPGNVKKFTGNYRDEETGLDYVGERYYAASLSRWVSPDALFADNQLDHPQSWNLYSYVANNPLRYIDPTGRVKVDKNGNIIFDKIASGTVPFIINAPFGDGKHTLSVTWQADSGYIYADDGTKIEASRATSDIKVTVKDDKGHVVYEGNDTKILGDSGHKFSCTADCHGVSFSKGQVWINNDQVPKLLKGDDFKETSAPRPGDIGIYSADGTPKTAVHSVTIEGVKNGKVTRVISKGGITPKVRTTPGPGPNTAWHDPGVKLRYYTKRQRK